MGPFLCFFFFLVIFSSASACDRCVHQAKVAYFSKASALSYPDDILSEKTRKLELTQIRCKNAALCTKQGTKVVVTDLNKNNQTDFVLSSRAFMGMANKGMGQDILKLGLVDVEYKRVPCDYKNQNLAVRVEEISQKPNYLAVKFLYQGGQTEIVAVDVAKVGSPNWTFMSRNYGAVWDTSRVPDGPLQFRVVVTSGYDGKNIWAQNVLPADWKAGVMYDSGVQISDIAQEGCSPCDERIWK
ncbi:hypothetical protein RHGRI_013312 [Rhododendron griersonianum]|uniref:Expansin-like A2 n=1 Tax=Rhododendron griersonianum TaxID=479676 RepID=A0AAV6K5F9_9ERIC|nr:hypothetical protein RHGRI_013312 [Rhododendron griersonianum]